MWEEIIKEKRIADHLYYVSLKYTKTCDVILNLIERWISLIDKCILTLLEELKKDRVISVIPEAPFQKMSIIKNKMKRNKDVIEMLEIYMLFKRIKNLKYSKEQEFRKGVALVLCEGNKEIKIDLEKLKELNETIEKFLVFVKDFVN
jgi:hypothetical protein